MNKEKMNLIGIEDMLNDYDVPEIETVEENVMKAVSTKRIKPRRAQILLAPIIGYLVSSVLFAIFYSRNAVFSLVWDFVGNRIIDLLRSAGRLTDILSAVLPPFKPEYLIVPLTGMFIISVGALVMEKKNKKKGGNK